MNWRMNWGQTRPLQAASSTYCIAMGPRAGRNVLSLHTRAAAKHRSRNHCVPMPTASTQSNAA